MSEQSAEKDYCEAVEGEFVWGVQRCMKTPAGVAIDPTWGTRHSVCAEHLALSAPSAKGGA